MIEFQFFGMPIKTLGSLGKIRVGRVTRNTHIFFLALLYKMNPHFYKMNPLLYEMNPLIYDVTVAKLTQYYIKMNSS